MYTYIFVRRRVFFRFQVCVPHVQSNTLKVYATRLCKALPSYADSLKAYYVPFGLYTYVTNSTCTNHGEVGTQPRFPSVTYWHWLLRYQDPSCCTLNFSDAFLMLLYVCEEYFKEWRVYSVLDVRCELVCVISCIRK